MFEIIEFDDGEFGIRDLDNGKILAAYGEVLSFKTRERAERRARKIAKNLNRQIRKAQKKGKI